MTKIKNLLAGTLAFAALVCGGTANAVTTYTLAFQGVTFTIAGDNGSNTFTLTMTNALSTADANWMNAETLQTLGFKDLGVDFSLAGTTATLTAVPAGGTAWSGLNAELNAQGCSTNGTPDGAICFTGVPPLALTDLMVFTVAINGGQVLTIGSNGPHLKLQFLDAQGNKEGSLLSQNLVLTSSTSTSTSTSSGGDLPEPGTLTLLGLGLLGLGFSRRMSKAK